MGSHSRSDCEQELASAPHPSTRLHRARCCPPLYREPRTLTHALYRLRISQADRASHRRIRSGRGSLTIRSGSEALVVMGAS